MGCDVATLALGGAMKAGGAADHHDLLWRWLGDRWEERIRVCFRVSIQATKYFTS